MKVKVQISNLGIIFNLKGGAFELKKYLLLLKGICIGNKSIQNVWLNIFWIFEYSSFLKF